MSRWHVLFPIGKVGMDDYVKVEVGNHMHREMCRMWVYGSKMDFVSIGSLYGMGTHSEVLHHILVRPLDTSLNIVPTQNFNKQMFCN